MVIGNTKEFIHGTALSHEGHTHDAGQIVSGILSTTRGGTGYSSLSALKSALGISSGSWTKHSDISFSVVDGSGTDNVYIPFASYNKILIVPNVYSSAASASGSVTGTILANYGWSNGFAIGMYPMYIERTGSYSLCLGFYANATSTTLISLANQTVSYGHRDMRGIQIFVA